MRVQILWTLSGSCPLCLTPPCIPLSRRRRRLFFCPDGFERSPAHLRRLESPRHEQHHDFSAVLDWKILLSVRCVIRDNVKSFELPRPCSASIGPVILTTLREFRDKPNCLNCAHATIPSSRQLSKHQWYDETAAANFILAICVGSKTFLTCSHFGLLDSNASARQRCRHRRMAQEESRRMDVA
jgi:hypothetical protein